MFKMFAIRLSWIAVLFIVGCQQSAEKVGSDQDAASKDAAPEATGPIEPEAALPVASVADGASSPTGRLDALPVAAQVPQSAKELRAIRADHDERVWSKEVLAQRYESTFVELWDQLIHQSDKYQVFKNFKFTQLIVGTTPRSETLDWQISRVVFDEPLQQISSEQWPAWAAGFEAAGYEIVETEFHHSAFVPSPDGATSQVSFVIHAKRAETNERFIVRGTLGIRWQPDVDPASGRYVPETIDATDLYVLARKGDPAFVESRVDRLPTDVAGKTSPTTIHPIILQDLNDDGLPEVIVGGFNHVYLNRGNWQFEFARLCEVPVPHVNAGCFADFDGDGILDYMAAFKNGFPVLYQGAGGGKFPGRPRLLKIAAEPLRVPINIVPGDIDGDGDLDVFLGQQKPGYFNGDIPTPYYDARDGYPCFVLLNDGQGNFTDVTDDSGLSDKRRRRNFAASWIDYDEDGDLDLMMTSDFSGTDLFENDGRGRFRDITDTLEPQAHAFGMSHTFGDYNLDGAIDFLTVGMSSTTARRLEQLRLGAPNTRNSTTPG